MIGRFFGVRRPSAAHARWIDGMAWRHGVSRRYIHFGWEIFGKTGNWAVTAPKTKATARVSRAVASMMRGALDVRAHARWSALRPYDFAS
jgi:hypothetical protein